MRVSRFNSPSEAINLVKKLRTIDPMDHFARVLESTNLLSDTTYPPNVSEEGTQSSTKHGFLHEKPES